MRRRFTRWVIRHARPADLPVVKVTQRFQDDLPSREGGTAFGTVIAIEYPGEVTGNFPELCSSFRGTFTLTHPFPKHINYEAMGYGK